MPDIEQWVRELKQAGWERVYATVWEAPDGRLFRGPYKAWCIMNGIWPQVSAEPEKE